MDMSAKRMFILAWTQARSGARKFGGKAKEYFAQALRNVWAEVKKARLAKKLAKLGMSEWKKGDMFRMYAAGNDGVFFDMNNMFWSAPKGVKQSTIDKIAAKYQF